MLKALVGLFLVCAAVFVSAADVGRLTSARQASVLGRTGAYLPAEIGRSLSAGETIRTGRRGFAEITFNDLSQVRLNERTDLVVEDSATLRRYNLTDGALWVKVAKGTRTEVRTPVGTATARGTIFLVNSITNTITVLEGTVQAVVGDATVVIQAGQSFAYQFGVGWVSQPFPFAIGPGGGFEGWFSNIGADPGTLLSTASGGAGGFGPPGGVGSALGTYPAASAIGGTVIVTGTAGTLAFISALTTVTVLLNPAPGAANGEPVPEPASGLVLLAGGALLPKKRRKPQP